VTATSTISTDTTTTLTSTLTTTFTSISTVLSTTTTTLTSTVAAPTPTCNGNYVTASNGELFCEFFTGYAERNDFRFYTTDYFDGSTSDASAVQQCADYVGGLSGVGQSFQVFYYVPEDRWHCDSSLANDRDSSFHSDTIVDQIYQYNEVGTVCS
jgi:hypothetical protein